MTTTTYDLESTVWAAAEGRTTPEELAWLEENPKPWLRTLVRLITETEEKLDSVRRMGGLDREYAEPDLLDDLARLWNDRRHLTGEPEPVLVPEPKPAAAPAVTNGRTPEPEVILEPEPVVLQASWAEGLVVVWAAGRGSPPADNDDLADRLEAAGAPAHGWETHAPVELPNGRADALAIPLAGSLGWLIAAAGAPTEGVGPSVTWMGRVALAAVRLMARGGVVPTLRRGKKVVAGMVDVGVQWAPAGADDAELDALAAAMPNTVVAIAREDARTMVNNIVAGVVDSVASQAARRLDLPAPPPKVVSAADVAESFTTRLNGSVFPAPVPHVADLGRRLEKWTRSVSAPRRPRLILQLDSPDAGGAWFLSVLAPGDKGKLVPAEVALADPRHGRMAADELTRLERLLPVLGRPGGRRRGQVVLSQDEAWELMTVHGASVEAAGFGVRLPALSRRKPAGTLRLFVEPSGESVVGAHQLSNVRWSVVFGDVELTAAEVARLAMEARPLVRSGGRWVELDRVDLKEAAAALAERASRTRMTGAEILRHGIGLEGGLGGGVMVEGSGWASDLLQRSKNAPTEPVTTPEGFHGELRSYQAQAAAWLRFLEATGLGGCLALDMGLGKTPTVLAHLSAMAAERRRADAERGPDDPAPAFTGPALVIAPPAVVGNWAAEARKFAPQLQVVVHHGASRAEADDLVRQVRYADIVITTYGTAVRDVEELAKMSWSRIVLDEAQAIKNPGNETAQQLRRIPSGMRLALTGTPIENGVGDLWAILDFTNPGLVGTRPAFVAQMSGEGEAALRALNGILVFRRTKTEPEVAAELPDRIDELDHCTMTAEQIGLYQAVLDGLVRDAAEVGGERKQGAILAAITALKQICNHPAAYRDDGMPLAGRSGKLARLEEIVGQVFAADERILIFTHFAEWGRKLADHLTKQFGKPIHCYDGSLARGARDKMIEDFQAGKGAGALVLSLKAGGTGLNLTAASHVVLYDRWWNPAVEDQARDRAWRIGQTRTVVSHRLVCPGTVDERVEEVVAGKRHIADVVLPKASSLADLSTSELRKALGLREDELLKEDDQ